MAEFVQQSIEEMLPELQQMERVGLFTMEETRQILKRRKRYEYKLRRRTKCKEDFLQYIQYEINALGLVRLRRKKTGYSFKRLEIDIAIVQRIHQLFRLALTRFKDDVKLWLSHIEFSKQRKEKSTVSRLFTDMLQVHNKKPGLWMSAAKWEFEDNANPENARSLLQRGLRFNPESKQLWLEYYRMELLYAEKMRKRREVLGVPVDEPEDEVTDAVLDGTVAGVVFKQALQALPGDVSFVLSFVPVTQLFDFTRTLENNIFEHLQTHFPHSELTWSALARRCLRSSSQNSSTDKPKKKRKCGGVEGVEDRCYQVFEEAVSKLHTEAMWTEYLAVCLERLEEKAPKAVRCKRTEKVLEIFKRAAAAKLLSSRLYICWLDTLVSSRDVSQTEAVGRQATERYPTNVDLWRYRLVLLTTSLAEERQVVQTLEQARKTVPDREIWPLWEVTMQYLVSINSESTEKYFQICTCSPVRELCLPAKTLYLKWAAIAKGIQHARHVYNRLIRVKPVCVELYRTCLDIEKSQATPKVKRIRRVYEDAVQDFGGVDTELWLDYIKHELRHPKEGSEKAGHLHFRAMKTLTGEHVERFITQYTLLQTGHSV